MLKKFIWLYSEK